MLERKAIAKMESWKKRRDRKPLIVQGARQVGKTFAVRLFSAQYQTLYELNFVRNTGLKDIFHGDLTAETILSGIRLSFPEKKMVPGSTLIFLDEIQDCPEAATALKFLAGDPRFDVIASGSALGMLHGRVTSWPVGQVEYLDMTSLDFEEFLWAMGVDHDLTDQLRIYRDGRTKIPEAIHQMMSRFLREYLVTGGMPDVVNAFLSGKDYQAADEVQRRIWRDYLADIAHYAEPEIRLKAQRCWQSIPMQLSKENHKFQYETVEHRGTARKFGTSVDWITASDMACRADNVTAVSYPLKAFDNQDQFRLYPNDIGLLICTYDFSIKRMLVMNSADAGAESVVLRSAKGGIYEALAADILQKRGFADLHFYRNTSGSVELEFLIENKDGVIPIEIKAGQNKTKSLDTLLACPDVPYGYKFADQNAGVSGKKITLPLYMLMFF